MLGRPRNFIVEFFRNGGPNNRLASGLVLDCPYLAAVSADLTPLDDGELGTLLGAEFCLHGLGFEFDDGESIAAAKPLHIGHAIGKLLDSKPGAERSVDERVA